MKEKLAKAQQELETFSGKYQAVSIGLKPLETARMEAVDRFAGGDDKAKDEIDRLDKKIEPLKLKLEGLFSLIGKAEDKVNQAAEALRQTEEDAEKAYRSALADHLQKAEMQEIRDIADGLPARIENICELYKQLCCELTELQLAGRIYPLAAEKLWWLRDTLNKSIKADRFRISTFKGYPGDDIAIYPLVKTPYRPAHETGPVLDFNKLFGNYQAEKKAQRIQEFEQSYQR